MLLLEHDAKDLLAGRGLPVPPGVLVRTDDIGAPVVAGPWMVKAQVPVGGRGKAGGILRAGDAAELAAARAALKGLAIRGHAIRELRIETAVDGAAEAYLGLSLDAGRGRIVAMASPDGGVDVEEQATISRAEARADPASLRQAVDDVAAEMPEALRAPVAAAGRLIAEAFLDLDVTLIELNPLFVLPDGTWLAADVRMAIDESALPRQPELDALLDRRAAAYPEATFKRRHGYDLVVVDPQGMIGLVTTGAGLSMRLIDAMTARGARPYNFCDIRSGMMRGDPARLIEALRQVSAAPQMRVILVNIFAGITDLGEFAQLLLQATAALPDLDVPIVVRLVGNGEERAAEVLSTSGRGFMLERDLDRAVDLVVGFARD